MHERVSRESGGGGPTASSGLCNCMWCSLTKNLEEPEDIKVQ